MKIGAHVSTAKPFSESVLRAKEIGCECMQIFVNPPQRSNPIPIFEEEIAKFNQLREESGIGPVLIHGIYLLNLASDNTYFYEQSIKSLIDDMTKASQIGAYGVNFHIGSTKGKDLSEVMKKVDDAVKRILDSTPENVDLILENSAGAGNIIGDTFEELAQIIEAIKSPRLKVLIDTAHAFESGYDIRTQEGLEDTVRKIDSTFGVEKLVGFHFNDSKTALDSKRDRHADIGFGEIGQEIFPHILNHLRFKDLFAILETPQDNMSWTKQIAMLKNMRSN